MIPTFPTGEIDEADRDGLVCELFRVHRIVLGRRTRSTASRRPTGGALPTPGAHSADLARSRWVQLPERPSSGPKAWGPPRAGGPARLRCRQRSRDQLRVEVSAFIDQHRADFGVELICRTLGVSASAYYERRKGMRSARAIEDERLLEVIRTTHKANYSAYGYGADLEGDAQSRRAGAALPGAAADARGGDRRCEATRQDAPHVGGELPADDHPAPDVDHEGQIAPALPGSDEGEIGDPELVGSRSGEVALDEGSRASASSGPGPTRDP